MRNEFGRQVADALAFEFAGEHEVRPAAEIQRGSGQRLIHRQSEAIAADPALVAQGLFQRLSQRQAGVLHRVVLIDMQIALGAYAQGEAAMLSDLLQHVIEERQTGSYGRFGNTIQVHVHPDPRLFRVPLHERATRRVGQIVGDAHPVPLAAELRGFELESADPQVRGEGDVGFPVADHRRTRPIDAAILQVRQHEADARLARGLVLLRPTAIDQHLAEHDALALEDLQHQIVGAVEGGLRIGVGPESVLIGDDHELVSRIAQPQQCRHHVLHETDFLIGVDLEIGRLLDQGSVAIDEQDRSHAAASCRRRAEITRSFCSGEPMVMRSASPSCGAARWSRTTTPADNSARKADSASWKRTSR